MLLYFATRLILIIVAVFSLYSHGVQEHNYNRNLHLEGNSNPVLEVSYRWDAVWYLDIARNGYLAQRENPNYEQWSEIPFATGFFPLLPNLIRLTHLVIPNWELSGALTALFLGALVLILLFYESKELFGEKAARWTMVLLICFPSGIFLSLPYAESLLLLGFLILHRGFRLHQWEWLALGTVITVLAKPIGIFLPAALIFCLKGRKRDLLTVLSFWILSLAMVISIYALEAGLPMAPFLRQGLSRGVPAGPWRAFTLFFVSDKNLFGWHGSWIDFIWAVIFTGILARATFYRRFSPFTLTWAWMLLILPLCSSLISFQRLSVVIFPVFTEIALLLKNRNLRWSVQLMLFLLLIIWTVRYAGFQWIG